MSVPDPDNLPTTWRAYHDADVQKTWFQFYVTSSAYAASAWDFAILYLNALLWFVAFYLWLEPLHPALFPVDGFALSALAAITTFSATFYAGIEHSRYSSIVKEFDANVIGWTVALAQSFVSYPTPNAATDPRGKNALFSVHHVLRVLPLAVKEEYKTVKRQGRPETRDQSLLTSGLELESLPLHPVLKQELKGYGTSYPDQMVTMVRRRIGDLKHGDFIDTGSVVRMGTEADSLLAAIGTIGAIKRTPLTPILAGLVTSTCYLYVFFMPFLLWGPYGWHGAWIFPLVAWPLLGLMRAGTRLSDPFQSYDFSAFKWNDMAKRAKDAEGEVDSVFKVYYAQNGLGFSPKPVELYTVS